MDLRIKDHVALVQGSSRGLGRGIAEALAAEGVNLLLTARYEADLATAAAEINAKHGVRVLTQVADSASLADMDRLVARCSADFGRLDILVCNSGGPDPGGIRDLAPDQWRAAAELLLVAPAYLLQRSMPLLLKSPAPRFFAVTSSSTKVPVAGLTLSNTFRPGVVGLMKSLVEELGPQGLHCHSIAPGRFDTERLEKVIKMQAGKAGKSPEEVKTAMLATIPEGRLGNPLELGQLVAFLSSPNSDYLNGGNWVIDGGLVRAI